MSAIDMSALQGQWDRCFEALALHAPEGIFESLVEHYEEPHRAYHTLQHIGECFEQFDQVRGKCRPGEVGLALWFHDAICDPQASDNEARSAAWAASVLHKSNAQPVVIERVERLIMATQHDALPQGHDEKTVVDIDLSIFGADLTRFREYEAQIRLEYGWAEDDAFRHGRINVLRSFLNRPFIYSTVDFRVRLEACARNNLARSIAALSNNTNSARSA